MTYRAGIVGCGRIGCAFDDDPRRGYVSTHAGAYQRMPGVELVALCDLDKEKIERYGEKFQVSDRYTRLETMLDDACLDILSVCTWSPTHLEIVRAAAEHGIKAIFCEKPMTDSLTASEEMIRVCADHNVILMIDHQRRFDPFHQQIAALIRHGGLGRVQQVTCYYTAGAANTGSHLFDLLRFYLGDAVWVEGRWSMNASPDPADPNLDGWIGFADGSVAAVQACEVEAYLIFEIVLLGTKGRLRITSSGLTAEFEEARESERFAGYRELGPAPLPVMSDGGREVMLLGLAHLLECLKTGEPPISSGEDGRAALEIICGLQQSAREKGRMVHLPLIDSPVTVQSR
ncbi:MAG TPA: Gfo/Idh/MocA family oxidoreductase [Terriglobia bacterium]|nr:Gfo/Idh/MocA family oxidoreductase [Terriglobia bacterium]